MAHGENGQSAATSSNLNDFCLTMKQVEQMGLPHNEVFELEFDGNTQGLYEKSSLKDFIAKNPQSLPEDTRVKMIGGEDWHNLYEHPFFQRRKPQLMSTQGFTEEKEDLFLLIEGRKHGPYTNYEVMELLKNGEVLYTDMVSLDQGESWGKIYHIEEFDRRNYTSENLPHLPEDDFVEISTSEVIENLENPDESTVDTDAMASLAYLETHKENPTALAQETESDKKPKENQTILYGALFIMSLIGIIYLLVTSPEQAKTPPQTKTIQKTNNTATKAAKKNKPKVSEPVVHKPKPVKVKRNNKPPRAQKKKSLFRNAGPSRESFAESESFKKFKDNPVEDEFYEEDFNYDQNDDPIELDPVRKRLSREALDPPEQYENEYLNEEFPPEDGRADRYPAGEQEPPFPQEGGWQEDELPPEDY